MKKRIITSLLVMLTFFGIANQPVDAATPIKKVKYEGNGVVEVDFRNKVSYKGAKVTVKDKSGKVYATKIIEKDNDDLDFRASNLKANTKYTFTISGVRIGKAKDYTKVSGSFTTPKSDLAIKKVDSDVKDRELEVEFYGKVQYKNLKVTVKDASGKKLSTKIAGRDNDEIELRVTGMKRNKKYTVTVSGVRLNGKTKYQTVSKTFTAK